MPASRSETAYRVVGTLVGVLLGAITAVWEALATPLTLPGSTTARLPVAILAAVVGNVAIVWFTYRVTRHVGLSLLPGVAWLIIMGVAGTATSEGDLILTGDNWVGLATIVTGSIAWAGTGYWLIMRRANQRMADAGSSGPGLLGGGSFARSIPSVRPGSAPAKREAATGPRPGVRPAAGGKTAAKAPASGAKASEPKSAATGKSPTAGKPPPRGKRAGK